MRNERKIRVMSRMLRYFCIAGMVIILPLTAMSWYLNFGENSTSHFQGIIQPLMPFLEEVISYVFFWAILFLLARLFGLYEQLEFFSKATVRYMRQIGILLLFSQLCYPVYRALHNYFLALPENKMALILFISAEVKLIFLSLIILLLGYIMEEGRDLADEYNSTI